MLKLLKPIEQIDTNIKKDIIINNIMKSKGVYLLVSNPKVGKSMLALQLSCSVINGTPFLGYKVNPSPVLYVTTESDKIQLKERLEFMELSAKKDSLFIIDRQNKANISLNDLDYEISDNKTVDVEFNSKLLMEYINNFISDLDVVSQTLFIRKYFLFEETKTLSKRFNLSENYIDVKLFRIRNKLKKYLESEGYNLEKI